LLALSDVIVINAAMAPAINALETAPPNTYWSVRSMHALYRRMARELDP